jgi:Family of unknown function (DUF5755)
MPRCPPGMICFPNSFSIFSMPSAVLVGIVLVVIGLAMWSQNQTRPVYILPSQGHSQGSQPVNIINQVETGDDRYSRSPEAERVWDTPPDYSRIPSASKPFNIPTQGVPESYQSMGIVKTADGKLLPLYGRRCISSRERYNYYTRTDSYNPLPIPVQMQGRDCQDQVGCPELFNGDQVRLSTLDQMGEVTIYRVRDISR